MSLHANHRSRLRRHPLDREATRGIGAFHRRGSPVASAGPGPGLGRPQDSTRFEGSTRRDPNGVAFRSPAGQTGVVTADQLEMISTDPRVMHGQAVIAGTRVPVSVILDCLAAGMTAEEIIAEYPTVTVAGVRAAAAYGAALAREELLPLPQSR
jgi:uncharacterized protein (DUF433 family)